MPWAIFIILLLATLSTETLDAILWDCNVTKSPEMSCICDTLYNFYKLVIIIQFLGQQVAAISYLKSEIIPWKAGDGLNLLPPPFLQVYILHNSWVNGHWREGKMAAA